MSDHHHQDSRSHVKTRQDELDSFLTTIESKLRSPFSSLDLSKAVSTTALRSSNIDSNNSSKHDTATAAAKEYLQNLSQVLSRTDKVIQCRMLIGLMGLADTRSNESDSANAGDDSLTPEILQILQETQVPQPQEEWVPTTSGLIQGIMFRSSSDNTRGSCRGEEAARIIDKQCVEMAEKIASYLEHHHQSHEDDTISSNGQQKGEPDLNACFAPYRYSLISTPVLNTIIPEFQIQNNDPPKLSNGSINSSNVQQNIGGNCHFRVNPNADILQVDWQLEDQRAKEEEQHGGTGPVGLAGISGAKNNANGSAGSGNAAKASLPPGFRPMKTSVTGKKPSTSLFMPTKKTRPVTTKPLIRRKGTAQDLVNRSKLKQRMTAAAGASGTVTAAGGAARGTGRFAGKGRAANAKAKTMMLDSQEASTLAKQRQEKAEEQQQQLNSRASKRKRILEASAKKDSTALKKAKQDNTKAKKSGATASTEQVSSAKEEVASQTDRDNNNVEVAPPPPQPLAEWEKKLEGRTNKLSEDDKFRLKQFFEDKHNPTPDQSKYKMKIHEQRGSDEKGQNMKETFYLELDYDTWKFGQSKKIKRY